MSDTPTWPTIKTTLATDAELRYPNGNWKPNKTAVLGETTINGRKAASIVLITNELLTDLGIQDNPDAICTYAEADLRTALTDLAA